MRREFGLVLLLGAAGAGLSCWRSGRPGRSASSPRRARCPPQDISVTGQQLVPLAGALALAALACLAAVIATRSVVRRVAGALLAPLGAGAAMAAVAGVRASGVLAAAQAERRGGRARRVDHRRHLAGRAVARDHHRGFRRPCRHVRPALARGRGRRCAAIVLAGLATVWRGPRWPVMSARFERPGQRQSQRAADRFRDDVGVAEPRPRPDRSWQHQPWRTTHRRSMAAPEPETVLLAEHEPEVAEMSARYLRRDGLRVRLVTQPGADACRADRRPGRGGRTRSHHARPGPQAHPPRAAHAGHLPGGRGPPGRAGWPQRHRYAGARRWLTRPFSPRAAGRHGPRSLAEPAAGPRQPDRAEPDRAQPIRAHHGPRKHDPRTRTGTAAGPPRPWSWMVARSR